MKSASPFSFARWGALLIILIFLVIPAQPAGAQYCMSYDPPDPFDTSADCRAMPQNDRTFRAGLMNWSGSDFLLHSRGNELEFMSLSNPQDPVRLSRSHFGVGYIGDEDYALKTWGTCDDCRYGYGIYSLGTVFFDLGTANTPIFDNFNTAGDYASLTGGMTFKHDGAQYVIHENIGGIGGNGVCGVSSGLFVFNGLNPDALPFVECVNKPDDGIFRVYGGLYVQDDRYNNGDAFVWLSDGNEIFIYKLFKPVGGGPDTLELQFVRILGKGRYSGTSLGGYAVDYDRGLAVATSFTDGFNVWELSDLGNPGQPVATRPDVESTSWLALGDGVVILGTYGASDFPLYSFDLSVLNNPVPLDQSYWDLTNAWNSLPCWGGNLGGTFTRDGDYLFLSRYEMMQRHDFTNCGGPQAPTARATMGRWTGSVCGTLAGDVFPGDEICAKSDSSGDILATDIWITDALGTEVARTSGGATAGPLDYPIPVGGTAGEPSSRYTAHVLVSNDVGETEDSAFTPVDLTPEASISFTPVAPLTGEDLFLVGDGEGEPGLPDGSDLPSPFEWTIAGPVGEPFTLYGTNPAAVDLAEAGLYEIDLTVYYRHGAAAPYSVTEPLDLEISSVSAAFAVTPTNPLNTADVVLDGSQSRWSTGVTPTWKWEYRQTLGAWQDLTFQCGAAQTCTISGSENVQFFTPGTYDFRLTLSNLPDVSVVEVTDVTIADGTVNLDFTWNPPNPAAGTSVGFTVEGVMGVDQVTWSFGGASCDGQPPQNWVCTPAAWLDCMSAAYTYSTSGNKTVRMTAVVNGTTYPAVTYTVPVSAGTCPGGGGGGGGGGGEPICTYVVAPPSRTVPAIGGSDLAISVTTQTGCTWAVSESAGWITVTSGSSGIGSGIVMYDVAANSGAARSAVMTMGGKTHTVNQSEPIPVDFTFTPNKPDIGEEVVFSVTDSRVTPIRWEFGGANCDGSSAVLDCSAAPAACRSVPWEYTEAGWKTVRLVTQEGERTHGIQVTGAGECCYKDGPPTAAFTMTPNPVFTREDVVFADASVKSGVVDPAKTAALGFTWDPIEPSVGDLVTFTITGVGSVSSAEWDMGGPGCGEYEQVSTCSPSPPFITCLQWFYVFASGGAKAVTLSINGGQDEFSDTITVGAGTCTGGGGGGECTYSISPSSRNFDQNGGLGTVTVSTQAGCQWTATESTSWMSITGGSSGTGNGAVSYSVEPNEGAARTANIVAAGKNHTVRQDAYQGPQDIEPTSWDWEVSLAGTMIVTSDQPTFIYAFEEPGLYDVRYEVSNCEGSDVEFGQLLVEQAPVVIPEAYLVPSAVHAPGENNTSWRTDLRVFNPDTHPMDLVIEYQPENTDNATTVINDILIQVPAGGTRAYDDILQVIPGIIVDDDGSFSGSLGITYSNSGEEEVPPLIVSRTYNDTPDGSFGQYVPAVPVLPADDNRLFLTGLVHNLYYRTNIRLANMSDESVVSTITLVDQFGEILGSPIYRVVQPRSTSQVNAIAEVAGVSGYVNIFSVQVDTGGPASSAWASVVDNLNGDPVFYSSVITDEDDTKLWVPGLARLPGENDSEWRSDVTFFNPTSENVSFDVRYFPSEDLGIWPGLKPRGLQPGNALYYLDILGSEMLPAGVESKGYFLITSFEETPLPQVAARTYNLSNSGGTFGQNVFVFRASDLVDEGAQSFVPGVAVSATNDDGFRTNLGVLNTDEIEWAQIRLTVLDENGEIAGDVTELWLEPGQFQQFSLEDRLNLPAVDMVASVVIEVLVGGPVGAYASTVDNRTQDPILIPAVPDITQLMR